MTLFTQFIWVFILLYIKNCVVLSTSISSGETEHRESTALKQILERWQDNYSFYRRVRRSVICDSKKDSYSKSNCTKNLTWDLSKFFKSHITENVDELESNYCKPKSGCLDVMSSFHKNKCNGSANLDSALQLLELLCLAPSISNKTCISVLYDAYSDGKSLKNLDGSATKYLTQFNSTSIRCCLAPMIFTYNSSGNVTELLPTSWKHAGIEVPSNCSSSVQVATTPMAMVTQTTLPKTAAQQPKTGKPSQATTKVPVKSTPQSGHSSSTLMETTQAPTVAVVPTTSSKDSSKLVASLIIASIIFVVMVIIISRFIYQRVQRRRRMKYEDYGYSQLKVILDDNLYDDATDDDEQLLSAT